MGEDRLQGVHCEVEGGREGGLPECAAGRRRASASTPATPRAAWRLIKCRAASVTSVGRPRIVREGHASFAPPPRRAPPANPPVAAKRDCFLAGRFQDQRGLFAIHHGTRFATPGTVTGILSVSRRICSMESSRN